MLLAARVARQAEALTSGGFAVRRLLADDADPVEEADEESADDSEDAKEEPEVQEDAGPSTDLTEQDLADVEAIHDEVHRGSRGDPRDGAAQ